MRPLSIVEIEGFKESMNALQPDLVIFYKGRNMVFKVTTIRLFKQ